MAAAYLLFIYEGLGFTEGATKH
ncbi:MAG: hypothetical protein AVDCRST_MAG90-2747, partial [uncultured Microvirga sp.]